MKFLRGQIFGLLTLLGIALPLQGMITNKAYQRLNRLKQLSGGIAEKQVNIGSRPLTTINTSVDSSKTYKLKDITAHSRSYSSPAIGKQSFQGSSLKSYSSSTVGQQGSQGSSFWNWAASFFTPKIEYKPLTPREIDGLLWGHIEEGWINPRGNIEGRMIFGDEDLAIAKEKIDKMIEMNPDYKHSIIEEYEYAHKLSFGNPKLTILDKVFFKLFSGDEDMGGGIVGRVDLSDDALNLIKLIRHLINQGATINPDNYDMYKEAYHSLLMQSYLRFYWPSGKYWARYGLAYEIPKFQEVFKELDPILGKVIPGFKDDLVKAQQERVAVESNPEEYKRKVEDKENRAEYMKEKAKKKQVEYARETGYMDTYWTDFTSKIQFDENEYQEWLRAGKRFFEQEPTQVVDNSDVKIQELKDRFFGQGSNPSDKKLVERINAYIRTEHPDALRNNKDISEEDKLRREKEFGEFMGRYDNVIKELKKNIKIKREQKIKEQKMKKAQEQGNRE